MGQFQAALAKLAAQISAQSYTHAQIDSKVANPGALAVSGNLSLAGEVRMPNVPTTILTSAHYATYASTNDGGRVGHVPSSRQYKRDIAPETLSPAYVLALQLVTFRYIAAVEEFGDDADT